MRLFDVLTDDCTDATVRELVRAIQWWSLACFLIGVAVGLANGWWIWGRA